jgi:uncharacterized protein DUF3105
MPAILRNCLQSSYHIGITTEDIEKFDENMTKRDTNSSPVLSGFEPETTGSRSKAYILIGVIVAVFVLGAASVLLNYRAPAASTTVTVTAPAVANVQTFPILSRNHINPGDTHPPYNSNPPTNGWHYPVWADWGIYTSILPDEQVIHNLEHGGVWISYRDSSDTQLISQLQTLVSNDPDRIIMTYRPQDDSAIALAAWGVLLKLDQFDADAIIAFIQNYRYHAPENIPGNAGG